MPAKKASAATTVSKPTYAVMVTESIKALGDRTGSSVPAISKHLQAKYGIGINKPALLKAIKKGVEAGDFVQIKASYKLNKKAPTAAPKPRKAPLRKKPAVKPAPKKVEPTIKKTISKPKKTITKTVVVAKKVTPKKTSTSTSTAIKKTAPTKKVVQKKTATTTTTTSRRAASKK